MRQNHTGLTTNAAENRPYPGQDGPWSFAPGQPGEIGGQFGPELAALIGYLTVVCRMPRRVVQELLEQQLGIQLSVGSIQSSWEEASEAVAETC
jgi:transposase